MSPKSPPRKAIFATCVLAGCFALVAALLLPLYAVPSLKKFPLDEEATTVSEGVADVLSIQSIAEGKARVDSGVPVRAQRHVSTADPADADVVTIVSGTTFWRTDLPGEAGLLTATIDRVTVDRVTGMPTAPVGTIASAFGTKPKEVEHTGLQYKFPFDVQKKSYPYFDIYARESFDLEFVEETEVGGLPVYHFRQQIEPVNLNRTVGDPGYILALPGSVWGLDSDDPVIMQRWYTNVRELWVEPASGVIVKGAERQRQFYARTADDPATTTAVKMEIAFTDATIADRVSVAQDAESKIRWGGLYLPVVAGVTGLLLLAIAAGLFIQGRNREQGMVIDEFDELNNDV